MITADQAITWLNWEKQSHLSLDSLGMLRQITDPNVEENRKQFLLNELENCSREMADPLERAEVLVYSSKEWLQRSCLDRACQLAKDAKFIYESPEGKDQHRQAVIAWIMQVILVNQLEFGSAFSNASMARLNFRNQAEIYKNKLDDDRMNWYHERVNEMAVDLAVFPEEAYEWLGKFEGSHLSGAAQDVKSAIRASIQKKNFPKAYQQIEILRQITQKNVDTRIRAEAYAFCGVAAVHIGNYQMGLQLFKSALANTTPTNHEYACIRWMMGLTQTSLPAERAKGIEHLETSIQNFESLRDTADHKNKPDAREWYEIQLVTMRKVLKNLV
jgi:hypothetical protein